MAKQKNRCPLHLSNPLYDPTNEAVVKLEHSVSITMEMRHWYYRENQKMIWDGDDWWCFHPPYEPHYGPHIWHKQHP